MKKLLIAFALVGIFAACDNQSCCDFTSDSVSDSITLNDSTALDSTSTAIVAE